MGQWNLSGLKVTDTPIVGWTHGDLEYQISDLWKVINIIESKSFTKEVKKNFLIKGQRINRSFQKRFSVL